MSWTRKTIWSLLLVFLMMVGNLSPIRAFHSRSQRISPFNNPTNLLSRRIPKKRIWNGPTSCEHFLPVPRKASQVDDEMQNQDPNTSERQSGILVLLTVPLAWGTFEPAVRYVYDIQPNVPPFVFQFVYYMIAVGALAALATSGRWSDESTTHLQRQYPSSESVPSLLWIQGGVELGTYLFLGNGMQVIGLKTIPSDRAAFLLQLTTIFVPLVQSLVARNLSILRLRTWIACFVALLGVACIGLDGSTSDAASNLSLMFSQGDLYIVLAALFYTFHCIRLETYAQTTPALQLALAKATTEAFWCFLVISAALLAANLEYDTTLPIFDAAQASGENIMEYGQSFITSLQDKNISPEQWEKLAAATSWIALVTIAYTLTAQSYGQARVPPASANLIYTLQPLYTAIIAFLVLGETLGPAGFVGGLLIASAVLLIIRAESSRSGG